MSCRNGEVTHQTTCFQLAEHLLPPNDQIERWQVYVNSLHQKYRGEMESYDIPAAPELTQQDQMDGYAGSSLFYGVPEQPGSLGFANIAQTMQFSWQAVSHAFPTYICSGLDAAFGQLHVPLIIRQRPKRWYWCKVKLLGPEHREPGPPDSELVENDWQWGPEWLQFIGITHPNIIGLLLNAALKLNNGELGIWTIPLVDMSRAVTARCRTGTQIPENWTTPTMTARFQESKLTPEVEIFLQSPMSLSLGQGSLRYW